MLRLPRPLPVDLLTALPSLRWPVRYLSSNQTDTASRPPVGLAAWPVARPRQSSLRPTRKTIGQSVSTTENRTWLCKAIPRPPVSGYRSCWDSEHTTTPTEPLERQGREVPRWHPLAPRPSESRPCSAATVAFRVPAQRPVDRCALTHVLPSATARRHLLASLASIPPPQVARSLLRV